MKMVRNGLVSLCLVLMGIADVTPYLMPPSNVTLHCHNFTNILQWNYDQAPADLKFRVDIGILSRPKQTIFANSSTLQLDLSFISEPLDECSVAVVAIRGQEESAASPPDGLEFSYLKDSPSQQKCILDFPTVDVTPIPDDNVEFSFHHPWLLYKTFTKDEEEITDNGLNRELPEFSYDVVVINQMEHHHNFRCKRSVCKKTVPVDGVQKSHCLKFSGELNNIDVLATQAYCSPPHQETDLTPLYIVLGLLILAAVVVVLFMVYRKKTRTHTPLPSFMKSLSNEKKQPIMVGHKEKMIVPEVTPPSPTQLLPETDVSESTPEDAPPDFRASIGVGIQENEPPDEEVRQAEDAAYMSGGRLDEDEVDPDCSAYERRPECTPYEKRPVVVEMGPEDLAQGYRD